MARRHPRTLTFMTGKINLPGVDPSIGCAILNVSDWGACILVPNADAIPRTFTLMVDPTEAIYQCHVRWKTGNRIGVSFQSEFDMNHKDACHDQS